MRRVSNYNRETRARTGARHNMPCTVARAPPSSCRLCLTELSELQSLSRHLMTKLDESRNMGQFSQAEIELLRKKLGVVVNAFTAERQKIVCEFNTVRQKWEGGAARV